MDNLIIFKRSFKYFTSNHNSEDLRVNFATYEEIDICDKVLGPNPVKLLVNEEFVNQSNLVYNSSITGAVIKDKSKALELSVPVEELVPASLSLSTPSSSKRGQNENSTLSLLNKRLKDTVPFVEKNPDQIEFYDDFWDSIEGETEQSNQSHNTRPKRKAEDINGNEDVKDVPARPTKQRKIKSDIDLNKKCTGSKRKNDDNEVASNKTRRSLRGKVLVKQVDYQTS